MNFNEAIVALAKGKKVKRPSQLNPYLIKDDKVVFYSNPMGDYIETTMFSTIDNVMAHDWEIVDEDSFFIPGMKPIYTTELQASSIESLEDKILKQLDILERVNQINNSARKFEQEINSIPLQVAIKDSIELILLQTKQQLRNIAKI